MIRDGKVVIHDGYMTPDERPVWFREVDREWEMVAVNNMVMDEEVIEYFQSLHPSKTFELKK